MLNQNNAISNVGSVDFENTGQNKLDDVDNNEDEDEDEDEDKDNTEDVFNQIDDNNDNNDELDENESVPKDKNIVLPFDESVGVGANFDDNSKTVTQRNYAKLMAENDKNKLKLNSKDLLPQQVNKDWFETDLKDGINVDQDNLIQTDKYVIGVNTVGQSLKNASYDLRLAPTNPRVVVSPWNQSTIEPDYNIKNIFL